MTQPTLPIIILAAGASTRMRGRDKLLEEVDGIPLIRRQAMLARRVTAGPVIIALPLAPHARYEALAGLDVTCLAVRQAPEGMGASLRAAVHRLPVTCSHVMVLLGDMPDLTEDDMNTVVQAVDLTSNTLIWRGATQDGIPGHPIIFHADLFERLKALKGDSGGRDVVRAAGKKVLHVPLPGAHARLDLDTPEAWAAWRKTKDRTP